MGSSAALGDEVVGLAAALLCNAARGRAEVMSVRNQSRAWRPGWCSAARKVSSRALTQIDAGAIFSSPVLQQRDPGRGVTLIRPRAAAPSETERLRDKSSSWRNKGLLLALDV